VSTLFHKLKVSRIERETSDTVTVYLEIPAELKGEFDYKAGQYLTLQVYVDGVRHRRAYSICTSPVAEDKNEIAVTSKRLDGGVVSGYLNDELKVGDTLEVFHPLGKFTIDFNSANQRNYVLIAAGSGITPLMAILKTVLYIEPLSKILLIYGNRNEDSIIFIDKLQKLQEQYNDRLKTIHALSQPPVNWSGYEGRISRTSLEQILQDEFSGNISQAEFFICGPTGMMEQVNAALKELHVPHSNIHIEYFTSPIPIAEEIGESEEKHAPPTGDSGDTGFVKVILNGEEYAIEVEEGETILDAALRQDIDPPYACQMGICTTCRARLHSGKVEMDEREGLTDDEIKQGFILTCQSHPSAPGVVVEYE
jgi:ring-1,2-phenylacetyl-CoA epoxidase subunit PaaE